MARLYWATEGAERAFTVHIGEGYSDTKNLRSWTGNWNEFIEFYRNNIKIIPLTREEYNAKREGERKKIKDIGGTVPATLKNGRRNEISVLKRDFISIDVDISPKNFIERWKRLNRAGLIHSTLNHTTESPRYRLIIPLNKPFIGNDKKVYTTYITQLIKILGLDYVLGKDSRGVDITPVDINASCNLAQLMYWPTRCRGETPVFEVTEGALFEPSKDIPLFMQAKAHKEREEAEQGKSEKTADLISALVGDLGADTGTETGTEEQLQQQPISDFNVSLTRNYQRKGIPPKILDIKTKDKDSKPVRVARKSGIDNELLETADNAHAKLIFDTDTWHLIPADREGTDGDEQTTLAIVDAIERTALGGVVQCYLDCACNEELFTETIYGDLIGRNCAEGFLKNVTPYLNIKAIFAALVQDKAVLNALIPKLIDLAKKQSATQLIFTVKRPYMPILAKLIENSETEAGEEEEIEPIQPAESEQDNPPADIDLDAPFIV